MSSKTDRRQADTRMICARRSAWLAAAAVLGACLAASASSPVKAADSREAGAADGVVPTAKPPVHTPEPGSRDAPAKAAKPDAKDPKDVKGDIRNLVGHGGPVRGIALSPDGKRVLTGSFDYSMIYWSLDGEKPKILKRFTDNDGAVNAVLFLPGGTRALSAGDDGAVSLWDLESGTRLHRFTGHTNKVADLALSPDGRLAASASWDHTVRIWDIEQRRELHVLKGHRGPVNGVAFLASEPGALFTAGYDGTIRRWNLDTGAFERTVYSHGWGINVMRALPAAGQVIFGSLNGSVGVVDVREGVQAKVLHPHEGPVLAIGLSADASLVATGAGDGLVRVWKVKEWALAEEHHNPYGPIWSLAFKDEGKHLYYSGLDDFVMLWQISPRQPFEEVEGRFPRRFQRRENMSLGELQFARKCSVCHTLTPDDANRAGPTLHGVFGRKAGSLPGYPYSDALRRSNIIWSAKTIGALFAEGPEHVTPGSKMPLQKISDPKKRDALVAFLLKATSADRTDAGTAKKK